MMLNCASGSCTTRLVLIALSTLWRNSSGSILAASTSTLPCLSVYSRPPGFTTSASPMSARYCHSARFCINTLLSTGTLASIFSTMKIWRQNLRHSSAGHQLQQTSRTLFLAQARRGRSSACPRKTGQQPPFVPPNLRALVSSRAPSLSSKVSTSPPNLGGLSPPIVTLTSGFSRPPARPPPLWFPHLAGWTPPAPCARPPPAAVESPIAFSWCPTPTNAAQCFPASKKQVGRVWAVSKTYPIQLNCPDSRPRARWCQLQSLPLVGLECVCPQCKSSFIITWGGAKPSAFGLPVHLSRAH